MIYLSFFLFLLCENTWTLRSALIIWLQSAKKKKKGQVPIRSQSSHAVVVLRCPALIWAFFLAFRYMSRLLGPFAETEVVLPLAVLLIVVHWPRSLSQSEIVLPPLVAREGGFVEGPAGNIQFAFK